MIGGVIASAQGAAQTMGAPVTAEASGARSASQTAPRPSGELHGRGLWVGSATYLPDDLVFTTHLADGRYRLCYFLATPAASADFPNHDIPPALSSNPADPGAYWYAFDPGCADRQAVLAAVAVPGAAAPWDRRVNPSMKVQYDHDVTAPPRVMVLAELGLKAGDVVAMQCVGGSVNGGGLPDNGCSGLTQFPPANDRVYTQVCDRIGVTSCQALAPSRYLDPASYPVYLMQVIGAFADDAGVVVGSPFVVTRTRRLLVIPTGASRLQLGVNDTLYGPGNGGGPNTGSLWVKLTAAE
jgi:hypothetical protein